MKGLNKPLKCHQDTRGAHHLGTAAPSSTVGGISTTAKDRTANATSVFIVLFFSTSAHVYMHACMCVQA